MQKKKKKRILKIRLKISANYNINIDNSVTKLGIMIWKSLCQYIIWNAVITKISGFIILYICI